VGDAVGGNALTGGFAGEIGRLVGALVGALTGGFVGALVRALGDAMGDAWGGALGDVLGGAVGFVGAMVQSLGRPGVPRSPNPYCAEARHQLLPKSLSRVTERKAIAAHWRRGKPPRAQWT
jgi:hypothetical protein